MGKTIKLIKNRSDIGAGTGSDLGIDAIEMLQLNKNSDFSINLSLKMSKHITNLF
jgi:arginase